MTTLAVAWQPISYSKTVRIQKAEGTETNRACASRISLFSSLKRPRHITVTMIDRCPEPYNMGRGAYDTTGVPKPPPRPTR